MASKSDPNKNINIINDDDGDDDSIDGKSSPATQLSGATPTPGNTLTINATSDRKSSATSLEALRQSLATTRPLPTFRSSPEIPLDNDDDEIFSDAERQLIATDSVTSTWTNVDNVYTGQLFKHYNAIMLGVKHSESPSPPPPKKDGNKVRINEEVNISSDNADSAAPEDVKGMPPLATSPSTANKHQQQKKVNAPVDSDAYTSADEEAAKDARDNKGAEQQDALLDADTAGTLIAAAQRNEPFDPTKSSTESRIKEERLFARRYRIKQSKLADAKNTELMLSLASGEDREPKDLMKDQDLSMANAQIERSDKQVFNVYEEGEVNLTNFTAGARKRYTQRRRYMQNELEKIQMMLEEEQMLFTERFAAINERWPKTAAQHEQFGNPDALKTLLDEQRAACAERLELKQRVIQRLQDSLRLIDEHYSKSLRKQEQDLTELSGNYTKVFQKLLTGFQDETHAVEDTLYEDLNTMKEQFRAQYEDLRREKLTNEESVLEKRNLLKDEFDNEIEGLRWTEADKFDTLKRKLESDVHTIEQQLVLMKAGFQMNAEKLDYNYQVLKRRDEENTILKAKQKRRITRLQDLLTKLRERQRKQEQFFEHDVEALSGDCSRLAQQIVDLHNKSKHFEKSDVEQFRNVWLVDELDIRHHVHHLLLIDRVISQQILGLDWQPPDMVWCRSEIGPIIAKKWLLKQQQEQQGKFSSRISENGNQSRTSNTTRPTLVIGEMVVRKNSQQMHLLSPTATAAANSSARPKIVNTFSGPVNAHLNFTSRTRDELFNAFHEINVQKKLEHYFVKLDDDPNAGVAQLRNISPILLAHLFERIASETGYMVESKVVPIINQMAFNEQKHQKFAKFDSILRALGVGTSNDVLKLLSYFVKQLPPHVLEAHTTFSTNEKHKSSKKRATSEQQQQKQVENASGVAGPNSIDEGKKVHIIEPNGTSDDASKTPAPDSQAPSNVSVTNNEESKTNTGAENDEDDDDDDMDQSSSISVSSKQDTEGPKKRRQLRPNELNELGLTLPSPNAVITKPRHRGKAVTKSKPVVAATMPPNLSPLEQAKWIKQQQQALAEVEAEDTNIAAIIQEENELVSNATVRNSAEAKKRNKSYLTPLSPNRPHDHANDDEDDEVDAESDISTNAPSNAAEAPSSRRQPESRKMKKRSKKSKRSKSHKQKSTSRNRSPKKKSSTSVAQLANADAEFPAEQQKENDPNLRLSDYIDPEYGCPDYMRVSEATNEILNDPMLNCLVPLDDVLGLLQQFIDDYTLLAQERSKNSTTTAVSAKESRSNTTSKKHHVDHNGSGINRNDAQDRSYFEQYLHMLDLELRLPTWRILFGKLHLFYIVMMERIKYRSQRGSQATRNDAMLDELGALMTSEHASKLLVPALTTIVGDYRKRSKLTDNWRAGGDAELRVLAKKKKSITSFKKKRLNKNV